MKSFAIKRDENDPRWGKFIEWLNAKLSKQAQGDILDYYGFCIDGSYGDYDPDNFDRIITLDEWEAEFVKPQLAGREYDRNLLSEYIFAEYKVEGIVCKVQIDDFLNHRYYKQERIAEIKVQMEKLSNELKELEG